MKIRKRSLAEILLSAPEMTEVQYAQNDDIFITVLGFEDRALNVAERFRQCGYACEAAFVIEYQSPRVDNNSNRARLSDAVRSISNVEPIFIPDTEAARRLREIVVLLAKRYKNLPKICLDISGATTTLVLEVTRALFDLPISLRICYTEAALYYPTQEELLTEGDNQIGPGSVIETGVSSVKASQEFPGQHHDPLPQSLIMVPGFNHERNSAMQAFVDESYLTGSKDAVTWLIGVPHLATNHWRCGALEKINQLQEAKNKRQVSTFDYKKIIESLDDVREDKWRTHNITVAFLGSKMQAVGLSIFCLLHPEVRVILSSPKRYVASHYSKGTAATWQLDFGSIEKFRNLLSTVGELYAV